MALGAGALPGGLRQRRTFTRASRDWSEYLPLPRRATCWRPASSSAAPTGAARRRAPSGSAATRPGTSTTPSTTGRCSCAATRPTPSAASTRAAREPGVPLPAPGVGRGGVSAPFFLRRLHGALFVDAGEAWNDGAFAPTSCTPGVGAELAPRPLFSYFLPLTVRLGVAAGLDEEGGCVPDARYLDPPGLFGARWATRPRSARKCHFW